MTTTDTNACDHPSAEERRRHPARQPEPADARRVWQR